MSSKQLQEVAQAQHIAGVQPPASAVFGVTMAQAVSALAVMFPPAPPQDWEDIADRVRNCAASYAAEDWAWLDKTRAYLDDLVRQYTASRATK